MYALNVDNYAAQPFRSGSIVNELETQIIELLELLLPQQYRCCPQVPLEVICARSTHSNRLPDDLWRFWVNSRVDIAIMDWGQGSDRTAKLVIECQSWYHNNPEAQERDRKKAYLLQTIGVPLLYVRRLEEDSHFYRFYTPDASQEVLYNLVNWAGRDELADWLEQWCDRQD